MKLSAFAFALTAALVWGGAIWVIGFLGLAAPGYGDAVLRLAASLYPGYHNSGTFGDVLVGGLYAFFDGLVGGYIFAWLYNLLAGLGAEKREPGGVAEPVADADPPSVAAGMRSPE